jgi:putative ABC transport system permease protein
LSKELAWFVLAANLLAWPAVYLAMNRWLDDFAYHIDLGLSVFAAGGEFHDDVWL